MANFIHTDNLTYCGREGQEIFSKMIYDLDLASSGITMMDNVKGKTKLYSGDMGEAWQAYTCAFSPSGQASLSEATMEPAAIKVNQEQCYDGFWNIWLVEQTKVSLSGGIPQTFFDWYFNDKLIKTMKKEYQEIFWKGDKAYAGSTKKYLKVTDGIEKLLKSDAHSVKVSNLEAFTIDNIVAQVEAQVLKANEHAAELEVDTEDYRVFMNYADVKLLKNALGKVCCISNSNVAIFQNETLSASGVINIMGYDVVPTMQSQNTVIVGPAKNLVLGYDTIDSQSEFKLIDMRETTGDNMFRVLAISNIAVGLVLGELFVYAYKTA